MDVEKEIKEGRMSVNDARMVDSTSDDRTVNNSTRQQYRVLSEAEKGTVNWLKEAGDAFIKHCRELSDNRPEQGREFSLAITHMEDAVMRAVRGVTA